MIYVNYPLQASKKLAPTLAEWVTSRNPLVSTNDGESGFREPSRRLKESQNGILPFISFAYMPYRDFVKLDYGSFAGVTGSTGDPRYYANHIGEKHL